MASNRTRRIAKEIADIRADTHSQITAEPVEDDDVTHLRGTFPGPPGTPYEGGTYEVDIKIPNDYPFRPPVMKFVTKVWHPNVSSQTGAICLDTLSSAWSPVLTIKSALLSLQSLLSTPEPKDPQDAEVATMLLRRPKEFERVAREWAVIHAGAPRKHAGEGSGGATDETLRQEELRAKAEQEREDLSKYDGYNKDLIDRFCSMGFDVDRVVAAFKFYGIDRMNGEDYELDEAYMGDITARLLEASLRSLRENTNAVASQRVRAALRRAREARQSANPSAAGTATAGTTADGKGADENDIDCLTPEEETELVRFYCEKAVELADTYKPPLPTTVRATAIQYIRRFYLSNSPMTYSPKTIMPCALFLATKTDNFYMSLRQFAEKVPGDTTAEDIIAPEFLIMQSLRFTFDVRHPFRGLEGGVMELQAMAEGLGQPAPHLPHQTSEDLRRGLLAVPPPPNAPQSSSITDRIARAHTTTRELLKTAAQMTDAYFLYTPSQIWLAAFMLADRPLAEYYLDTKLGGPTAESANAQAGNPLYELRVKLLRTLNQCAALLQSYKPLNSDPEQMKNLKRIGKKFYYCQNPEKISLAGQKRIPAAAAAAAASAGEGATSESEVERQAKKRKLEREQRDREARDIFGGELVAQRVKEGQVGQQQHPS
ncbi:hypothetical protein KXW98_001004 [Aspergillus fumigatus]|uniref:Ubiquitin-conjugating enzyme E2 1 n=1 Tax=Aspergillus fumigatus TaxID=746128 RepID=A0A8H4MLY1_ASPFM|nr:hypothetical protein CNMCM8714_001498 [Aspergillus fumigatus]KAF4268347.1 hypothetical protein CNMCM8812_001878 [Aspergillus fumigatus]KAF4276174.1 hypothetical protein CNMCM8057_004998 [Aspergillus fumigatus]KAF4280167.1 hypothetical protein CNMCM8689_002439 [Aspergillus fumigatus]KAH1285046.1 hypothetical protein KXX30_000650 [Aspergillus fumigatus]